PRIASRSRFEPEFGGDHHLSAKRCECFAHKFFVGERSVDFSSIEERDAAFHRCADKRNHLLLILRRPVPKAHPHAAESDRRHFQPALPKFALFHSVTSKKCVCCYGLTIILIASRSFIAR